MDCHRRDAYTQRMVTSIVRLTLFQYAGTASYHQMSDICRESRCVKVTSGYVWIDGEIVLAQAC